MRSEAAIPGDSSEEFSGDSGWIPWFCGLKGHEIFAEVEEEYIRDNFNLYGLRTRFQYYDDALEMILSSEAPDDEELADTDFMEVYRDATELYGLIHARYIVSPRGLQGMREKYLKGTFGMCPRVLCDRQHVLAIGTAEEVRAAQVKVFCPKCEQIYAPKSKYKELDGAFFGMSFPQYFLQSYPALMSLDVPVPFVPRVFGFKLHKQKSLISRKIEDERTPAICPQKSSSATSAGGNGERDATTEEQQNREPRSR
jgi:casein kinase II subunit beta